MNTLLQITPGDTVSVVFHNSQSTLCRRAIVIHVPTATGDSWIFNDLDTEDVHYVSEGCTVTKAKN